MYMKWLVRRCHFSIYCRWSPPSIHACRILHPSHLDLRSVSLRFRTFERAIAQSLSVCLAAALASLDMSASPFYCQSTVSSLLQPCCSPALIQPNLFQCNFTDGEGIRTCLSKATTANNSTQGLSCSDQNARNLAVSHGKKMNWPVRVLVALAAFSAIGLAAASPNPPSRRDTVTADSGCAGAWN